MIPKNVPFIISSSGECNGCVMKFVYYDSPMYVDSCVIIRSPYICHNSGKKCFIDSNGKEKISPYHGVHNHKLGVFYG